MTDTQPVRQRASTSLARWAGGKLGYRPVYWALRWRAGWLILAWWAALFVGVGATRSPLTGWRLAWAVTLPLAAWFWWLSDDEKPRRASMLIGSRWARACIAAHALPKLAAGQSAPALGPRYPTLRDVHVSHGGNSRSIVAIPPGMTLNAEGTTRLDKLAPVIVSHLHPRPLTYDLAPADRDDHARLTLTYWRAFDGQSGPIPYEPGEGVFVSETGEAVPVDFPGEHTLVVAQTGGGKSGILNAFIAEALHHPHRPELWGVDLKLTELTPWERCFARLALDPDAAVALVVALEAEQVRRQAALAKLGQRIWTPGCGFPPLLLIVDELNQVVSQTWGDEDPKAPSVRRNKLARAAALGRATGVQILAATQDPKADVIAGIKPNMQTTICGHVRAENDAVTALGPGLAAQLSPETLEPPNVWVVPASRHHYAARARWLDDATVQRIAAAHQRRP